MVVYYFHFFFSLVISFATTITGVEKKKLYIYKKNKKFLVNHSGSNVRNYNYSDCKIIRRGRNRQT